MHIYNKMNNILNEMFNVYLCYENEHELMFIDRKLCINWLPGLLEMENS